MCFQDFRNFFLELQYFISFSKHLLCASEFGSKLCDFFGGGYLLRSSLLLLYELFLNFLAPLFDMSGIKSFFSKIGGNLARRNVVYFGQNSFFVSG